MVYYFTSKAVDPAAFIYVGKDKFERWGRENGWYRLDKEDARGLMTAATDEELIKYGWEEDVWFVALFHADKLSSAHIYLRLPDPKDASVESPMTWDAIPEPLLVDLAQLTKANSIEGNKKDNVTVIYTPWSNLRKDGSMEVGQVSFKDPRKVKKILVPQRENPVVNRLNKTRVERKPDLQQEREDRLKELRKRDQAASLARKREEARIAQERKEKKWQKDHAYDDIFTEENMESTSNQNRDPDWEDDFM
ncbi:Coiled-coil domain-containing protein 25 [Colletotrichum higginsianum IMI 349063]|uniref:Coiled-coil domain-containing protein 25 n=1 Tax=Colletotrichum higginsianum (strain IMI 349063) TaxID=759273 RepID=A0A1B7YRH8_COLHI|nr:Coiled-coil domain-containing protein 25 [Colletotrichum higginsianum IMI 349063]OBR14646.1 Coiled-coil domain-containing protein 25 [Colletotrichum higginsianum IMI 349063]GJD05356.1 coiled-coil domain-containing protein 25 [Colletotrichum higginsianum]